MEEWNSVSCRSGKQLFYKTTRESLREGLLSIEVQLKSEVRKWKHDLEYHLQGTSARLCFQSENWIGK